MNGGCSMASRRWQEWKGYLECSAWINCLFVCLFVGITKGQGPVFISFIGQTESKLFYILRNHNVGLLVYFVLIFTPYYNSTILLHKSFNKKWHNYAWMPGMNSIWNEREILMRLLLEFALKVVQTLGRG